MKPMRPEEVAEMKRKVFPPEVFEAFNELIAEHFVGKCAEFKVSAAASRVKQKLPDTYKSEYLNVEDAYRSEGWNVVLDRPGMDESYAATFIFTAK